MDAWKESFELLFGIVKWLLGLIAAFALTKVSKIKANYDAMQGNVKTLMEDRAVLLEVQRRELVERSGHDRRDAARADAMDFYNMDEQRRSERRSGWPK